MRKLGLRSRDIDGVIKEVLDIVRRNIDEYIYYFYGWDNGYGASALLSYMARVLPSLKDSPPGLSFGRIVYLDCSMWESQRVMQRKIAEQLKLGPKIMARFEEQDEEDDINGVNHGSRDVIRDIAAVINRTLRESMFMLIFINGSDDEINLTPFGIPEYHNCVIIWTSRRFDVAKFYSRDGLLFKDRPVSTNIRYTSIVLHSLWSLSDLTTSNLSTLLHEEAAILACLRDMDLTMAIDGFFYSLFMYLSYALGVTSRFLEHVQDPSSYWICDGVIQGDKAREISNALRSNMIYSSTTTRDGRAIASNLSSRKRTPYLIGTDDDLVHACGERPYRWIAMTLKDEIASKNNKIQEDMQTTLATASSIFLGSEQDKSPFALLAKKKKPISIILLDVLFKQCNNVSVLILARCSFSFTSPPFLHCHTLRLLELDHCTDGKTTPPEGEDDTIQPNWKWACLHSLQVLHLQYTEWGEILSEEKLCLMANLEELNIQGVWCWQRICELEKRLPSLKKLRIIHPRHQAESSADISNSLIDKTKLEVLDLSGNIYMTKLPASLSKASRLQELVLDGCEGIENVDLANSSLKSFSLCSVSNVVHTSKISLKGCTQLENLMLHGLYHIVELDLSGCAIKVLDIGAMRLFELQRIFLLGCEHLYAIRGARRQRLLCIDTRPWSVVERPSIALLPKQEKESRKTHAIFADARLARSLMDLASRSYYNVYLYISITSSTTYGWPLQPEETRKGLIEHKDQQHCIVPDLYNVVFKELGDATRILAQAFPQPPPMQLDHHIEIGAGSRNVQSEVEANDFGLGDLMRCHAESLHVHDVAVRAATPTGDWCCLRWCRVERCPNLEVVFPSGSKEEGKLETIWASDLLKARCIWSKGRDDIQYYGLFRDFKSLRHLHLRSCPSIQYILPLWFASFPCLESLHIIHCGSLRHVFEQDDGEHQSSVEFPKLTTINLHDVPVLRQICEDAETLAPALEAIMIRGCWSLHRLPALKGRKPGIKKPAVEMEKDVWDVLEWDGVDEGHHPSLYAVPVHSRYYKKRFIRRTVLR